MRLEPPRLRPDAGAWIAGLIGVAVYLPSLRNGFAYDDEVIVAADPRLRDPARWGEILTGGYWPTAEQALYRPVTTFSFAVDWLVSGGDPAWFHFVNTVLHGGVTVLVCVLLASFFSRRAAFIGALVFAVHPVHVEAVANVVGRAELLAAAFGLGLCTLWLRPGPTRAPRALGAAALLLLALLSKESAVALLPILPLLDVATGRATWAGRAAYLRDRRVAGTALLGALIAFLGVRALVLGRFAPERVDAVFDVAASAADRIPTALQAWPVYLRLLSWPGRLIPDYGPRVLMPASWSDAGAIAGAAILLGAVAAAAVCVVRGRRTAALALLWLPLTVLPVSNLLFATGVIVAERTLYLPSVATSFAVAGLASLPIRPLVLAPAAVAVAAVLAGRAIARIPDWRSTESMIEAFVRDRPDAFRAQWYAARLARQRGDTAGAIEAYLRAAELWPWRRGLVIEAGRYAAETGRLHAGHGLMLHATRAWPDDLDAKRLLAGIALDVGDTATARSAIAAGLRIAHDDDVLLRMHDVANRQAHEPRPE
jgi:hypothetical protein